MRWRKGDYDVSTNTVMNVSQCHVWVGIAGVERRGGDRRGGTCRRLGKSTSVSDCHTCCVTGLGVDRYSISVAVCGVGERDTGG